MQNLRTYGTCVGTHGALGLRLSLIFQAKTVSRALAIGVMVLGALVAFEKTADASIAGTTGTFIGAFEGNTNPIDNVQDVLDGAGGFGITNLTFYSKQDYANDGSVEGFEDVKGNLETVFNTDPPGDPTCQSGSNTCGSWTFDPNGTGPLVTLLAIKASNFFGLWIYNDTVANTIDQLDQHGLFDTTDLYLSEIVDCDENGENCSAVGIHGISHISVYGDLVTTVIPLPAALPLFLTALAGLGGMTYRRRRKQASAAA